MNKRSSNGVTSIVKEMEEFIMKFSFGLENVGINLNGLSLSFKGKDKEVRKMNKDTIDAFDKIHEREKKADKKAAKIKAKADKKAAKIKAKADKKAEKIKAKADKKAEKKSAKDNANAAIVKND